MLNKATSFDHAAPQLRQIAKKLFWWKSEAEALEDPIRFAAQVMTLGTWRDVLTIRAIHGDALFIAALKAPPPGVFDARSWNYWHLVFEISPIPDLPMRKFP
ncbi:MAG: hypothetical protein HY360_17175 [Verrucomicrobia bacterium]|nr:hypothetical protein [Verrucomicrobiota bacterium]